MDGFPSGPGAAESRDCATARRGTAREARRERRETHSERHGDDRYTGASRVRYGKRASGPRLHRQNTPTRRETRAFGRLLDRRAPKTRRRAARWCDV